MLMIDAGPAVRRARGATPRPPSRGPRPGYHAHVAVAGMSLKSKMEAVAMRRRTVVR